MQAAVGGADRRGWGSAIVALGWQLGVVLVVLGVVAAVGWWVAG